MSMKKTILIVPALVAALAIAGSSSAQISTGGIRGIVKDATGAVLIGVTVEAVSPARRSVTSYGVPVTSPESGSAPGAISSAGTSPCSPLRSCCCSRWAPGSISRTP